MYFITKKLPKQNGLNQMENIFHDNFVGRIPSGLVKCTVSAISKGTQVMSTYLPTLLSSRHLLPPQPAPLARQHPRGDHFSPASLRARKASKVTSYSTSPHKCLIAIPSASAAINILLTVSRFQLLFATSYLDYHSIFLPGLPVFTLDYLFIH